MAGIDFCKTVNGGRFCNVSTACAVNAGAAAADGGNDKDAIRSTTGDTVDAACCGKACGGRICIVCGAGAETCGACDTVRTSIGGVADTGCDGCAVTGLWGAMTCAVKFCVI